MTVGCIGSSLRRFGSMSATAETFRVDNPHHMAVARDIGAAVGHLNKKS
jgi:hypothetical protein